MEIRLKYINQDSFYGSDYFIKRVDYEEKWDRVKRLEETYYENELLERSVTEKYGSNLKVAKVENTAAAIGTTGNGKLSIDEYVGHNLENVDKLKTVGASVGVSASGITSLGVNYSDRKQEGITKNTVIGNVEIGKSSGDEINKDFLEIPFINKIGNRENFFPDEFEIQKRFKDSLDKINCLEANNTKDKIQVFIKNFDQLRFMDRYNLWVYIVENILIKKFIEGQEIDIYAVFEDNIW